MRAVLALLVVTNALSSAAAVMALPVCSCLWSALDRTLLSRVLGWALVSWVKPALLVLIMDVGIADQTFAV
jgi:hypothetical protein